MNSFYSKLKEDDKFLNHLFNNKEDNLLNIFYLINRIINNIKEDTIIITPNKRELAYITSIFSSLNFFYKNYQDQYLNFEKWLVPGNYVSLVSSGKHTGTIYKYLGRENNGIKLETVPKNKKDNITQIWQKIDTILQFAPYSDYKEYKQKLADIKWEKDQKEQEKERKAQEAIRKAQEEKELKEQKRLEAAEKRKEELEKKSQSVSVGEEDNDNLMGKIKRLKVLYKNGTLTKAEFEKAKNKLLK